MVFKTKRLTLRPLEVSDYEAWKNAYLILNKEKQNRFDTSARTAEQLKKSHFLKIIRRMARGRKDDKYYHFGIFLKNGTFIGIVSIMDISRELFQNGYLGYRIFHNYWGKGYGKEAVSSAIKIAFKQLKLHRVEAGIELGNRRSIALARSVGLKKEGFSRRRIFLGGKWIDLILYAATSEDFGIPFKSFRS